MFPRDALHISADTKNYQKTLASVLTDEDVILHPANSMPPSSKCAAKMLLKNPHAEKVPTRSPGKRVVAVCFRVSERTGLQRRTL